IADPDVRTVSFERVPKKVLHEAIEETQGLIRPRPDEAIDCFGKRYSDLRQFVPLWLQTLTLRAQGPRSGDRPLYALRGGLSGAGANSTDSSIAANIERGF